MRPIRTHFICLLTVLLLILVGQVGLYTTEIDRPNADSGEPTPIKLAIFVLDFDGIDSQSQTFEANVFVHASWSDPRLVLDQNHPMRRPAAEVWSPPIQILNQQRVQKTLPDEVKIDPDRTVTAIQRYWGRYSQPLNLRRFPFDSQTITIQVLAATGDMGRSVSYEQSDVVPSGHARVLSIADWDVSSWEAGPRLIDFAEGIPHLGIFEFSMVGERRTGYYIIKVPIPLILIICMSWIVFWIDPKEAGTQISVSITSMLTLIAYRFSVDSSLPKVSYLTSLDMFIMLSTIILFLALIQVLLKAHISKKDDRYIIAKRMDLVCRGLFPLLFLGIGYMSFVAV